ncbi:50S ribosomal protein L15 [Algoriphagus boritolerans]|uniref:Large ribosomal subunit protein uL15 n=1 Tax=Algoriphagus boritolerans DSM 17298 = JCM 18970 TaxID=1120964 RepID=A0A1H5T2Q1_9BACT|nr:50S ribosomal protein L15 [Algoriphagus boritolerans]SEF57055.1 large subunit ribosomal protein L15 [Algoriphagus boritolerans DSM 17298 = JCM 18970]
MKLNTLTPSEGSTKNRKRIGRGTGSGRGGTSTRGHKGAKSRSGYKSKIGFEGGQMPLQRRVPKFGFKSFNRVEFKPVNLDTLQTLAEQFNLATINMDALVSHGIASKNDKIKILGGGELTAKIDVTAHKFSASAVEAIEKLGGAVNKIS